MKIIVKLIGLTRVEDDIIGICQLDPRIPEETFKVRLAMNKAKKEELWNFCEGNWPLKEQAIIDTGGTFNGKFIDPVLLNLQP